MLGRIDKAFRARASEWVCDKVEERGVKRSSDALVNLSDEADGVEST